MWTIEMINDLMFDSNAIAWKYQKIIAKKDKKKRHNILWRFSVGKFYCPLEGRSPKVTVNTISSPFLSTVTSIVSPGFLLSIM
jgi:hypothetical protein